MSLCGEMHDGVNLLCFQDIAYKLRAADIAFHKLIIRIILDFVKILQARAVYQLDENKNKFIIKFLHYDGNYSLKNHRKLNHEGIQSNQDSEH